jgi:hypothetical protein
VVQPELARNYFLATASARKLDDATQAVMDVLVDETRRLIASGRWEAELLLRDEALPKTRGRP